MSDAREKVKVQKALEGVATKLASPKLTSQGRLELLRRQAELGDARDALAQRARRQAAQ
jgi:hypothetical protein